MPNWDEWTPEQMKAHEKRMDAYFEKCPHKCFRNNNIEGNRMFYGYATDDKENSLFETHLYGYFWWKDQIKSFLRKIFKPKLILIRGLPGSGKSTLAKNLAGKTGIVHSVDDYFMKDGVYKFEEDKLSEYHDLNLYAVIESMEKGISPIVVDNTNLMSIWSISYVSEAEFHNYVVSVEETQTPWKFDVEELFRRNIHGVPKERLQVMKDMYEPIEKFKKNLGI